MLQLRSLRYTYQTERLSVRYIQSTIRCLKNLKINSSVLIVYFQQRLIKAILLVFVEHLTPFFYLINLRPSCSEIPYVSHHHRVKYGHILAKILLGSSIENELIYKLQQINYLFISSNDITNYVNSMFSPFSLIILNIMFVRI